METDKRNTLVTRNAWKYKQGGFQERNPIMVLKKLEKFLELKRMTNASKKKLQELIKKVKPLYKYERSFVWKVRCIVV